jgi:hypothetical protein
MTHLGGTNLLHRQRPTTDFVGAVVRLTKDSHDAQKGSEGVIETTELLGGITPHFGVRFQGGMIGYFYTNELEVLTGAPE